MKSKHQELKLKLTSAIVELCRQEAFYCQDLRIEGTLCLVSDGSSVLITHITEQIGEGLGERDDHDSDRDLYLDASYNSSIRNGHKEKGGEEGDGGEKTEKTGGTDSERVCQQSTNGKYSCPFCTKVYRFKHSLKDHINKHTGRKPHVCKHCGCLFTHLPSLCAHIRRKHSAVMSSEFRCSICEQCFLNDHSLKKHIQSKHNDRHVSQDSTAAGVEEEDKKGPSPSKPMDGAPLQHVEATDMHKTGMTELSNSQKSEEHKEEAGKELIGANPSPTSPQNDARKEAGPSDRGAVAKDFLTSHSNLMQASLDFQQQAIAMGLPTQPPLNMAAMFPGMPPPGLPFTFGNLPAINRSLPTSPALTNHSKPINNVYPTPPSPFSDFRRTEDGKFQCPYCEKAYNFKHTLKDHINKHTGARPHVCKHCGDTFTHLASLCNHIKRRHEEKIPQEFQCELCHERFMNYQSVKQHYTWRHKEHKFPERFGYTPSPAGKRTLTGFTTETKSESPAEVPPPVLTNDAPNTSLSFGSMPVSSPSSGANDWPSTFASQGYNLPVSSCPSVQPPNTGSQYNMQTQSVFPGQDVTNVKMEPDDSQFNIADEMDVIPSFEDQDLDLLLDNPKGQDEDPSRSPSPSTLITEYFDFVDIPTEQGRYKYKCKVCSNMFKIRSSLQEHVNSHLGRKPHVCTTCGDSFTHHSSLHNHVKNRHSFMSREEREASFKHNCLACGRKFRYPSELDRHLKANPDHENYVAH